MTRFRRFRPAVALAVIALIAGCAAPPRVQRPPRRPADVRAEIVNLLPAATADRQGWAIDIAAAFTALDVDPDTSNICATLAIIGQESNYTSDPPVPGLGRIARAEIDRRAEDHNVPQLLVRAALSIKSANGKSYADRIAAV